jgi:hypothetical protein
LVKDLKDYKNRGWENISLLNNNNPPTINLNGQLIPNMNFNPNLEAYSEYFNYGYNPISWKYKVEEFKEKIVEIRKKLTEEEYKREFINEYNLEESTNENFYLWNLPLELGGVGDYLKNTYYLNFFNTNKRGIENIPSIEYNKFNSHYVNLPTLERGNIDKREVEVIKPNSLVANSNLNLKLNIRNDFIAEKNESTCKPSSPVVVGTKDKLNNTNFYLKNNNSFNMKNDTNYDYNYSTLPYTIENKSGKLGKVDLKGNFDQEKNRKNETKVIILSEKTNDVQSESSISSSESRNNKKNNLKSITLETEVKSKKDSYKTKDKYEKNDKNSKYRSSSSSEKNRKNYDKSYKYKDYDYKKESKRGNY